MLSDPFLPYNNAINRVATQNDHEEKIILTALRKLFPGTKIIVYYRYK